MNTFAILFKKYRLKAEFASLTEFADALAEAGHVYETSIFYHWQSGTRIPSKRTLVINLIELFINRKGITSMRQANEFLASTGYGYLTESEQLKVINSDLKIQ